MMLGPEAYIAADSPTHQSHPSDRGPGAPPLRLFAIEQARALHELSRVRARSAVLEEAAEGDGHPVLVLPGFLAGDSSTLVMRRFLRRLGYDAHGWKLGINFGLSFRAMSSLHNRLRQLTEQHGRQCSLVGWSLGGLYARELTRLSPDLVRMVITMGSNFRDISASRVVAMISAHPQGRMFHNATLRAHFRKPVPVPMTSIYSKTDGVVHWRGCLVDEDAYRENIEVKCSHIGMGFHPQTFTVLADRLSQSEGEWKPFSRHPTLGDVNQRP